MKVNKILLFLALLLNIAIFTLVNIYNIDFLNFRTIFSFLFLSIIPGLLTFKVLEIKNLEFWENTSYTIGLSIAYLILNGLLLNTFLPLLNIKPLTLIPLLISVNLYALILGILLFFRSKNKIFSLQINIPSMQRFIVSCFPVLFVVMSIMGSISLNNYGSNVFVLIVQFMIAIYVIIITISNRLFDKINASLTTLLISISLLLMWALRSTNVSGGDIGLEFYVFQQTKFHAYWSTNFLNDAYNACLSITILPTILEVFTHVKDEYVFKLFFSIFFSFTPLYVFLLSKRYVEERYAFLSSFFFMIQYPFIVWMPMLARQEIALIFFGLILLMQFNENISTNKKKLLFLIFGFSLILSHYSVAYISLSIFLSVLFLRYTLKITFLKKILKGEKFLISPFLIITLLLFTYLWQFKITNSANNLQNFVYYLFNKPQHYKTISASAQSVINLNPFKNSFKTTQEDVENYSKSITKEYKSLIYVNRYDAKNSDYHISSYIKESVIPVKNEKLFSLSLIINKFTSLILKLFFFIGIIYIVIKRLNKENIKSEFIITSFVSFVLLIVIIIIPDISLEYNYERLLQQALFALCLPLIFGAYFAFKVLKLKKFGQTLLSLFFVVYFLNFCGFINQIVGGDPSPLLNNFGLEYDQSYTLDSEVSSIKWLSSNYNKNNLIYVDKASERKVIAYGNITKGLKLDILPSTLDKNAYVFLGHANFIDKIIIELYNGKDIKYNLPENFLNSNKDLIYNNGSSVIYK